MRYGRAKAGAGPVLEALLVSGSRGEEVGRPISLGEGMAVVEGGGGCMAEKELGSEVGTIGSGRAGIASSADEVSMVICTVDFEVGRWV